VRLLSAGHNRKTDADDAAAVAIAAADPDQVHPVTAEDHAATLRLLTERRDDLVNQRTRTLNRLHVLLRDLVPGGARVQLSLATARQLLRRVNPTGGAAHTRRQVASAYIRDLAALDRTIAAATRELKAAVTASRTTLTDLFGIDPVLAAKIIAMSATCTGSPPERTSRPGAAPPRSKPPAATSSDTDCLGPATAR